MARRTWGLEVKLTYRDRVRVNEQLVGAISMLRVVGAIGRRKRGGVCNEQRHVSLPRLIGAKPGTFPEWNVPRLCVYMRHIHSMCRL
jgi:hypothetical protein